MQTLQNLIRWLPGLLAIAAVFALFFPGTPPPTSLEWERAPTPAGGGGLTGHWAWVESRRGDDRRQPLTRADSLVILITPYGAYREFVADSMLRSRYWFAEGRLNQEDDSIFTVLVVDSSTFFPRNGEVRGAAVRHMTPDSLFLSGIGSDATLHSFIRVRPRETSP